MSMHIVFMVSKYIIYVLSDFRDQIPLREKILDMNIKTSVSIFVMN